MEESEFNDKYWFHPLKIITVANPLTEDFIFKATTEVGFDQGTGKPKIETRTYKVKAGGKERFPGPIANLYLDQVAKLMAQNDKRIQNYIDYSVRAEYYDQLIVGIDNLADTYHSYDKEENSDELEEIVEDKPFAEIKRVGRPPKVA